MSIQILGIDIGIRNYSYTLAEFTYDENKESKVSERSKKHNIDVVIDDNLKILKWDVVDLTKDVEDVNYQKIPADLKPSVYPILIRNLHYILEGLDITPDIVVVESQAKFQEEGKLLENYTFGYYCVRRFDNGFDDDCGMKILTQSAGTKLKFCSDEYKEPFAHLKSSHSRNKKTGTLWAETMILNSEWIDTFKKHKKRDDLADSLLHIHGYILNNYDDIRSEYFEMVL